MPGDLPGALRELGEAAASAPDNSRHAYVYATALHSAGYRQEAVAVLTAANARHPYNPDILDALVSFAREQGPRRDALSYAWQLQEALPDDPGVIRLVRELERGGR